MQEKIFTILSSYLERLEGKAEFESLSSKEVDHLERIAKILESLQEKATTDNEFTEMSIDELKEIAQKYSKL